MRKSSVCHYLCCLHQIRQTSLILLLSSKCTKLDLLYFGYFIRMFSFIYSFQKYILIFNCIQKNCFVNKNEKQQFGYLLQIFTSKTFTYKNFSVSQFLVKMFTNLSKFVVIEQAHNLKEEKIQVVLTDNLKNFSLSKPLSFIQT